MAHKTTYTQCIFKELTTKRSHHLSSTWPSLHIKEQHNFKSQGKLLINCQSLATSGNTVVKATESNHMCQAKPADSWARVFPISLLLARPRTFHICVRRCSTCHRTLARSGGQHSRNRETLFQWLQTKHFIAMPRTSRLMIQCKLVHTCTHSHG